MFENVLEFKLLLNNVNFFGFLYFDVLCIVDKSMTYDLFVKVMYILERSSLIKNQNMFERVRKNKQNAGKQHPFLGKNKEKNQTRLNNAFFWNFQDSI